MKKPDGTHGYSRDLKTDCMRERREAGGTGAHELLAPAGSFETPAASARRLIPAHELLAPAGSFDTAKEVIAAGADAVYLAGTRFGARAYAANLQTEELLAVIDYAHLYGRQIHLTVNTLLKNREIQTELYEFIRPLYMQGLDAVIVQDFGVFHFLKENFPDLALHASTQMSVTSAAGARFLQEAGASRVVAARELSLSEIRSLTEQTGIEVESFIHGALCYSFSGQCLLSSMIGGRSGNRGRCAQPCRLPYRVEDEDGRIYNKHADYPLSPKDLCALDLLPRLCEAGVYSFKIEGRMKQAGYAAGVTEVYRRYLDLYETDPQGFAIADADRLLLQDLGSRSGFTKGYYVQHNGRGMLADRDSSYYRGSGASERKTPQAANKTPVQVNCRIRPGEPLLIEAMLPDGGKRVSVSGDPVQIAENRPLSAGDVKKRLQKTGDTPFAVSGISLELDPHAFLPVRAINEARRELFARLEQEILCGCRRSCAPQPVCPALPGKKSRQSKEPCVRVLRVMIADASMLAAVLCFDVIDEILFDLSGDLPLSKLREMSAAVHNRGKKAVYCFPYIFREDAQKRFYQRFADGDVFDALFDAVLVRSYDALGFALHGLRIAPERIRTDYNLYRMSEAASSAFYTYGIESGTVSPELNRGELKHMDSSLEMIVYGLQPVMFSAQCVYKNYQGCRKQKQGISELLVLREADAGIKKDTNRKNAYAVRSVCADCYNIIYGSRPLYLLDKIKELPFLSLRLSFVQESGQQIGQVLNLLERAVRGEEANPPVSPGDFGRYYTRGHFNRGVE